MIAQSKPLPVGTKHRKNMCVLCVGTGGYGPPLTAGRGTPTQPPSPFNAFLVTTPAGGFAAPQGYPQQGYGAAPQFGQSFSRSHSLQFTTVLCVPMDKNVFKNLKCKYKEKRRYRDTTWLHLDRGLLPLLSSPVCYCGRRTQSWIPCPLSPLLVYLKTRAVTRIT